MVRAVSGTYGGLANRQANASQKSIIIKERVIIPQSYPRPKGFLRAFQENKNQRVRVEETSNQD